MAGVGQLERYEMFRASIAAMSSLADFLPQDACALDGDDDDNATLAALDETDPAPVRVKREGEGLLQIWNAMQVTKGIGFFLAQVWCLISGRDLRRRGGGDLARRPSSRGRVQSQGSPVFIGNKPARRNPFQTP